MSVSENENDQDMEDIETVKRKSKKGTKEKISKKITQLYYGNVKVGKKSDDSGPSSTPKAKSTEIKRVTRKRKLDI